MKIVLLSSEVYPFAKTGGLADVAGSLPRALHDLGHQVAVMMPAYRRSLQAAPKITETGIQVRVPVGSKAIEGRVLVSTLPKSEVPVYLIDQPAYFDREHLYGVNNSDYPDNCERFVFFQRAALETIRSLSFRPDVIHCNDWQTGLIPVYLNEVYRPQPGSEFRQVGTLLTIHNLAYQGAFWHFDMSLTGLDWSLFTIDRLEAYGQLNFLKAGLVDADLISTVSPTYAQEIQTPEFGRGLDGLLRSRQDDLRGIVNGTDPDVWNPRTDPNLAAHYDIETWSEGKAACKAYLQRRANLPERPEVPLLATIGRLDHQKGWNLIVDMANDLLQRDVQLITLGTGDSKIENNVQQLVQRHPRQVRAYFEFSDPLSHQIEAGADLFLMPSLYEPCGLNQLYSLAYGTVPIVRATGGLADTVVDTTPETLANQTANGFRFFEPSPEALAEAINRALARWPDRPTWSQLVRTGMASDWTWHRSARNYETLYQEIQTRRRSRVAG